jgi:hypothetical protein
MFAAMRSSCACLWLSFGSSSNRSRLSVVALDCATIRPSRPASHGLQPDFLRSASEARHTRLHIHDSTPSFFCQHCSCLRCNPAPEAPRPPPLPYLLPPALAACLRRPASVLVRHRAAARYCHHPSRIQPIHHQYTWRTPRDSMMRRVHCHFHRCRLQPHMQNHIQLCACLQLLLPLPLSGPVASFRL